ncbi:hypothetical protein A3Q56_08579 [Intoshia linei]|uniref:Uncharacterized protein n=1 Tax=Intoshia linei TaxID=1819745 RepID=A0A177ANV0_9BILA|nr:hypothetical protein A3Q56_08579 [Intoshia linei]
MTLSFKKPILTMSILPHLQIMKKQIVHCHLHFPCLLAKNFFLNNMMIFIPIVTLLLLLNQLLQSL